jgi:hypothetical protein
MGLPARRVENTCLDKAWKSIRILRQFTLPDLIRTSGAKYHNVKKFVRRLVVHGYIAENGNYTAGRAGQYKGYRIVEDTAVRPRICRRCGLSITSYRCGVEK